MPPLRVAYYIANHHRFTGGQRSLHLLVGNLDRREVEPIVIAAGDGYCTRMFRELGVRVVVEEPPPGLQGFGGSLVRLGLARRAWLAASSMAPYARRIASVLRQERVDIAHYNEPRGILLAGLGARLARRPIVWHLRGLIRGLGRTYVTACCALPHRILPVAHALESEVPAPFRRKIVTVHNGIRLPTSPPGRTRAELLASLSPSVTAGRDDVVAVAVGSIVPFKGIHHLLEALHLLGEGGRRVWLVLVGDWPNVAYKEILDARLARWNLGNVRFAGWDPQPLDWFRAADVAVLPTVEREMLSDAGYTLDVRGNEGFPRAILEAMSCGKPVVASRVAGVPEQLVEGESGLMVPPGDPPALAAALAKVVADPALRERLGARGRTDVRKFSIEAMVEKTTRVYHDLV